MTGTEVRERDGEAKRAMCPQTGEFWAVLPQLTQALSHLTCAFFWEEGNELDKDGLSFGEPGPQNLSHSIPKR